MQIMIREARLSVKDEFRELQALLQQYFAEIGIEENDPKASRLLNLKEIYQDPSRVFVAECDGKLAGCVCVKQLDQNVAEIQQLFVSKNFRKDGVGKSLLAFAVEYGLKTFSILRLDSRKDLIPAITLYHSIGFYEIERYNDNSYAEVFFEITESSKKWCAREESNP